MARPKLNIFITIKIALLELSLCLFVLLCRTAYVFYTNKMLPYFFTFIAVAVFPLFLAGIGGHLATLAIQERVERKRWKIAIWVVAFVGITLFGVVEVLQFRSDQKRDVADTGFRDSTNGKLQTIIDQTDPAKKRSDAIQLQSQVRQHATTARVMPLETNKIPVSSPPPSPPPPKDPLAEAVTEQLNNCQGFLKASSDRELMDGFTNELKWNRRRILQSPPDLVNRDAELAKIDEVIKQQQARTSQSELRLWNDSFGNEFWITYSRLEAFLPAQHTYPGSMFTKSPASKPESLDGIKRACNDMREMFGKYKPH